MGPGMEKGRAVTAQKPCYGLREVTSFRSGVSPCLRSIDMWTQKFE
jgi:hypothetical protein